MSSAEFHGLTTSEEVIDLFSSRVEGRTFVITGTGALGIGAYTALALARAAPGHLILVSRSASTTQPAIEDIKAAAPNVPLTFVQCDLSDQDAVRAAAATILEAASAIDVLINNAGIMAIHDYTTDKRGNEIQLSSNHIGHFLLTNLLVPALLAAAKARGEARVVNLTSHGHRMGPFRFDDYNFSGGAAYQPYVAYGQSKTANILFAVGLTKRLGASGVTSTAVHPGSILGTGLPAHIKDIEKHLKVVEEVALRETGRDWVWELPRFKTKSQGSSTTLVAALDPEMPARSPAYLSNCQIRDPYEYALDPENAEKLWKLSEELVGQKFTY